MRNKYGGPCAFCKVEVKPQAGQLYIGPDEKWAIVCEAHAGKLKPEKKARPRAKANGWGWYR